MNEMFEYLEKLFKAEVTIFSIESMFQTYCNQIRNGAKKREAFAAYKEAMENEFELYHKRIAEIEAKYRKTEV